MASEDFMNRLKNVLRALIIGSFTMLFLSCFGISMPFSATLKVKTTDGSSGIPDLRISYKTSAEDEFWMYAGTTDLNGEFQFSTINYSNEEYNFKIEDVDEGEHLGTFEDKIVNLEDDLDNILMTEQ